MDHVIEASWSPILQDLIFCTCNLYDGVGSFLLLASGASCVVGCPSGELMLRHRRRSGAGNAGRSGTDVPFSYGQSITLKTSPFLAHEFRNVFGNPRQINVSKIGESDDREFVFDVPRQDRFKTPK